MKRSKATTTVPPQLQHLIQKEAKLGPQGAGKNDLKACLISIDQAKENELRSYLELCHVRLGLEPSPLT